MDIFLVCIGILIILALSLTFTVYYLGKLKGKTDIEKERSENDVSTLLKMEDINCRPPTSRDDLIKRMYENSDH